MARKKVYNRIKEVLDEKKKTQAWLAGELDVEYRTVNRYCSNASQPTMATLYQIGKILKVHPRDLLAD